MANYDVESHTYLVQKKNVLFVFIFGTLCSYEPVIMKRLFFPWKTKEKKARFARAPHDNKDI